MRSTGKTDIGLVVTNDIVIPGSSDNLLRIDYAPVLDSQVIWQNQLFCLIEDDDVDAYGSLLLI